METFLNSKYDNLPVGIEVISTGQSQLTLAQGCNSSPETIVLTHSDCTADESESPFAVVGSR